MKLSVEVEPPKGVFQRFDEGQARIYDEILDYVDHVDMISITNRPVFGLSPLTLASQVNKLIKSHYNGRVRVNLHLTTRLSHYDAFKYVLDSHRIGLSDILPILGDPRGPQDPNYFANGFELLGFVSYLKSGNTNYLSSKYNDMLDSGNLSSPIKNTSFNVGNVIDVNPERELDSNKRINIRDLQLKYARKKQALGAEYLISQCTFNADNYFSFLDEADLKIPILAGVMPARLKLINMFGIPIDVLNKQKLRAQFTTDEEKKVGNQMAKEVYSDLLERGCELIHVYSIGNSKNFGEITDLDITNQDESELSSLNKQKEQKLST